MLFAWMCYITWIFIVVHVYVCVYVYILIAAKQAKKQKKIKTLKTQWTVKTSQRNTKCYNTKTTDTVLAGLLLAESVGYDWYFLVLLGIRGNFEGALKRERSAGTRGGRSKWCKHDLCCTVESKKIVRQLFSACCEAGESSKEQSTWVRLAISAGENDVEKDIKTCPVCVCWCNLMSYEWTLLFLHLVASHWAIKIQTENRRF